MRIIDRVDEELVHAPATTGARFSGADDSEVRGGKSVACRMIGGCICWDCWRGGVFDEGAPLLRDRGGEMGDIFRELVNE